MHHPTSLPRRAALAAGAAVLLATTAFAQRAPNKVLAPITVVDAAGRTVGRFDGNRVLVSVNGLNAWIDLVSAGNDPLRITWAQAVLVFGSADCTGAAFTFDGSAAIGGFTTRVATVPGGQAYAYLPAGPQQAVLVGSTYIEGRCSTSTNPSTAFVVPLSAPIDLSAQFTTPLALQ